MNLFELIVNSICELITCFDVLGYLRFMAANTNVFVGVFAICDVTFLSLFELGSY